MVGIDLAPIPSRDCLTGGYGCKGRVVQGAETASDSRETAEGSARKTGSPQSLIGTTCPTPSHLSDLLHIRGK